MVKDFNFQWRNSANALPTTPTNESKNHFSTKKKYIFPQNGRTTMKTPRKQITKQTNKDSEKNIPYQSEFKKKNCVWLCMI